MREMRAIAVDDEVLALNKISRFCNEIDYVILVARFDNPTDALAYLRYNRVDLLFLDIRMDEMTGIEMLMRLENKPFVILTTAFSHYSIKAFELDVADYLLKPVRFERFKSAVAKVYERWRLISAIKSEQGDHDKDEECIFLKAGRERVRINLDDILYIEGMKDYLSVVTIKRKYLTLMVFDGMLKQLPSDSFVRIHRSYIIQVSKIDIVGSRSVRIGNRELPVSKTFRKDFELVFRRYIESREDPGSRQPGPGSD